MMGSDRILGRMTPSHDVMSRTTRLTSLWCHLLSWSYHYRLLWFFILRASTQYCSRAPLQAGSCICNMYAHFYRKRAFLLAASYVDWPSSCCGSRNVRPTKSCGSMMGISEGVFPSPWWEESWRKRMIGNETTSLRESRCRLRALESTANGMSKR